MGSFFQAPWNKESQGAAKEEPAGPPPGPESVKDMAVGQRCECMPGGRRGTVMYLGEVEGLGEGYWVSEEEGLEEVNGIPCSCWTCRGTSRRGRPVYGFGDRTSAGHEPTY